MTSHVKCSLIDRVRAAEPVTCRDVVLRPKVAVLVLVLVLKSSVLLLILVKHS